jgi:hypothetical protein
MPRTVRVRPLPNGRSTPPTPRAGQVARQQGFLGHFGPRHHHHDTGLRSRQPALPTTTGRQQWPFRVAGRQLSPRAVTTLTTRSAAGIRQVFSDPCDRSTWEGSFFVAVMTPTSRHGARRASASSVTLTPAVNGIRSGVQHRRSHRQSLRGGPSSTGRVWQSRARTRSGRDRPGSFAAVLVGGCPRREGAFRWQRGGGVAGQSFSVVRRSLSTRLDVAAVDDPLVLADRADAGQVGEAIEEADRVGRVEPGRDVVVSGDRLRVPIPNGGVHVVMFIR